MHRLPVPDTSWRDMTDWWIDPRLAYAAGMADGYQLGRADQDAVDDAEHRAAVRAAIRVIDMVDRRRGVHRKDAAA